MNHLTPLAARVAAVNRANAEAKRLFPILRAAFAPFIGQKVVKASNTRELFQAVKKALPELPNGPGLQVWIAPSNSGVWVNVKTCEVVPDRNGMGIAYYHETGFMLCSLNVRDWQTAEAIPQDWVADLRSDWTAEQVSKLRADYKTAREQADKAKSALHPFGEYDR